MCRIFGVISTSIITDYKRLYNPVQEQSEDNESIYYQSKHMILMFHPKCSNHRDKYFKYSFKKDPESFKKDPESFKKNKKFLVLCNGKIYDYIYLKNTYDVPDKSYIYPLFKELHTLFYKLNIDMIGEEYSIAIIECVDYIPIHIYLSTDTSSTRSLLYIIDEKNGIIAFSSLLKDLTNIKNINKKEIKRLPGGHILDITLENDNGSFLKIKSVLFSCYLDNININALLPSISLTDKNIIKPVIINLLVDSIKKRCYENKEIGCYLDGGIDTSFVATIANKYMNGKLKTFSIGMEGDEDLKYSKLVSEHIQSEHTEIIFTKEEGLEVLKDVINTIETFDVITIRDGIYQYLLAKWISKNTSVDIILLSEGSDELQNGFLKDNKPMHEYTMKMIDNIYLYNGLRADRCFSRFGLETRFPYLDYSLVEYYKTIHPSLKCPDRNTVIEKYLFRTAVEEQNILTNEIIYRIKKRMSSSIKWISNDYDTENNKYRNHCCPYDNESLFYREIFEKIFGEEVCEIIPYYFNELLLC